MKITNIEPQKNSNRVNIYIDNKFAFGLSEELRYKFGLHIEDEIEQSFIDNILKSEEQANVTNYALKLLSYRQKTEVEMYKALKKKGYDDIFIEYTIKYLKENKYINDLEYARMFINDKQNLNKYGPNRIKFDLIKKGISKEIIESTLNISSDEEYDSAYDLAFKKQKSYHGQDRYAVYRKLGGFLQRKGYSYDTITKVLDEILRSW
ncbi:RecX family transcriptional regulator [Tissierella sp. Yu-01]|uniref:regulatory protein RecX n=1 Tax=Tissierella sp. Yu-01 TaxID=3035694 RepID=UPI00240D6AEF|nr:RecX family transcriptional regulator [Tissierella sp. Yu-01]WFA09423.1 RecX family transcriptional regulator [Tissierella sp. Yu-01]